MAFGLGAPFTVSGAENRPNILIIFTDDQGYTDLGIHGVDSDVRTPSIDRLAADGVRFTNGYVTAPQCTPSRAGLMAGRHQNKFGLDSNGMGPMPLEEYTLAERLQAVGYATGMVGKWHLANDKERGDPRRRYNLRSHLPHAQGFEEYWCSEMSWYYASHDLEGKPLPGAPVLVDDARYRIHVQTEAALAFLERREDDPRPFFLYLAYFAPHAPVGATPELEARLPHVAEKVRRQGLASILAVDDGVAQIRERLAEMGVADNTLIFFISDNGAPLHSRGYIGSLNAPLVGEKGTLLDGGIRVPYLMAWPERVPAGQVFDPMVSTLDATATALAVADAPRDERIEGKNLLPYVTGRAEGSVHEALFWRWRGQAAIRSGDWKFLRLGDDLRYLFDLSRPGLETADRNQIARHPELAAELEARLLDHSMRWRNTGLPEEARRGGTAHFATHVERNSPKTFPEPGRGGLTRTAQTPQRAQAPNDPAEVPTKPLKGWLLRQGDFTADEAGLRLTADSAATTPMFLTRLPLELAMPVRVSVEGSADPAVNVVLSWRTPESGTDFLTQRESRLRLDAGATSEAVITGDGVVSHIRLVFPKSYNGAATVKRIVLTAADGEAIETNF